MNPVVHSTNRLPGLIFRGSYALLSVKRRHNGGLPIAPRHDSHESSKGRDSAPQNAPLIQLGGSLLVATKLNPKQWWIRRQLKVEDYLVM